MNYLASVVIVAALVAANASAAAPEVRETGRAGDFPLVAEGPAVIACDEQDHAVVALAARCLAEDVERVSGARPRVGHEVATAGARAASPGTRSKR